MLGFFTLWYSPPIFSIGAQRPSGWPASHTTQTARFPVFLYVPPLGSCRIYSLSTLFYPMCLSFKNKTVSYRIMSTFLQIIICRLKYQFFLNITLLCYRIYNLTVSIHQTKKNGFWPQNQCILFLTKIKHLSQTYHLNIAQKLSKSDYIIPTNYAPP